MAAVKIPNGAITAIVTPFFRNGGLDMDGFWALVRFQVSQEISGIVPCGTTGESATLDPAEHAKILRKTAGASGIFVLSGCGSNNTKESMEYIDIVAEAGGGAVLLVDPYYNRPASLNIRKELYEPIAAAYPEIAIVPYIIPPRTCCKLYAGDLAVLSRKYPNVLAVKEATGDLANMAKIRLFTSPEFQIFSGDDDLTFKMMTSADIKACGVISVISNIAPAAVQKMCQAVLYGNISRAEEIRKQLEPLFKIVTVTNERTECGEVILDKFSNPMPIKTAMNALGMPAGPCRPSLGKMSAEAVQKVREALSIVWKNNPEILQPIESHFNLSIGIDERLKDDSLWKNLAY